MTRELRKGDYRREFYKAKEDEWLNWSIDKYLEYYERAEMYDQSVCSRRNDSGIAFPVNTRELVAINKNAHALMIELRLDACDPAAKGIAFRMFEEKWRMKK